MTKKSKLIEAEVVAHNHCNHCNEIIQRCTYCDDYLEFADIIFCKEKKHYCSECVDEHKEKIEDGL